MKDKKLEPCPFCGVEKSEVSADVNDLTKKWGVWCGRCGANKQGYNYKILATQAWNTRPLKESGWQGMEMSINQMVDIIGEHLRIGKRGDDWSIVGIREAARAIHAKLSAQPGRGNNG